MHSDCLKLVKTQLLQWSFATGKLVTNHSHQSVTLLDCLCLIPFSEATPPKVFFFFFNLLGGKGQAELHFSILHLMPYNYSSQA